MVDLISADFGIRQLHACFADAVWRQDASGFAACFAEEGVWKIAGFEFAGRVAIEQGCAQLVGRCVRVHLLTGQPLLEVEGHDVLGRVAMTEIAWMPDGNQYLSIGTYHDRYCRQGDVWRFARRHWSFKYRGELPIPADLVATPDYGAFPGRPADDEATFVRKA